MKTKTKRQGIIKNNLYFLGKIAKISPWRVFHGFLSEMLDRATWAFFTVVFFRYLFSANEITRPYDDIARFLLTTSAAVLVITVYQAWHNNVFVKRADQKISFKLNRELFDKVTAVDISCYENPSFYDQYTKAATEASERSQSVIKSCAVLVSSVLSTSFVVYNVSQINLYAGLLSFIPLVGTFFFGKISQKLHYDRDMENVPHDRRMGYVNRVMYLQQYAKELRLTNIFALMKDMYDQAFREKLRVTDKYWRKLYFFHILSAVLTFTIVFQGGWLLAAYWVLVDKSLSIGDFIMLANGVVSITWMLFGVRDGLLDSIKNTKYIQNIRTFLDFKPRINECQTGLPVARADNLELKNVSFRYTEDGDYILRNVSLNVRAGEKVCLVGHNGAGKSTLIKLIMRLYDPSNGQILLNGIDIRNYDLKQYRAIIGVAFQDFQMFSMSVAENVIMKRVSTPKERERAVEALRQSGIYEMVASLPHKEDSILTREFDNEGIVLSGGQYQKIAAARAFAKEASILLLDEPSSALDPVAEYIMYETIMRLCAQKGNTRKISIIISHRLSTATSADCVYLLEQGEILEHGAHKALLAANGAYAKMYAKQAENYLAQESGNET